jgi:hypothetical protein
METTPTALLDTGKEQENPRLMRAVKDSSATPS